MTFTFIQNTQMRCENHAEFLLLNLAVSEVQKLGFKGLNPAVRMLCIPTPRKATLDNKRNNHTPTNFSYNHLITDVSVTE